MAGVLEGLNYATSLNFCGFSIGCVPLGTPPTSQRPRDVARRPIAEGSRVYSSVNKANSTLRSGARSCSTTSHAMFRSTRK